MQDSISLKEKASFGLGAVGKDMAYWIMAGYLMIYFTDVINLSPAYVGVLFLIARLWDAINDPVMGWIVDNTKTRFGKFRPWILIGTIVNSIIVLFLFYDTSSLLSPTGVMIYYGVFYILWGMSYTIMDIPYWSMIPSFSSDSKVRDLMSVIPRTGAMIGGQSVIIFGLPIITYLGSTQGASAADGFFRFTCIVVAIFIICEIICTYNVKEHVQTPLRQKISISGLIKILSKNDQLVVIIVLTIIQQLAQNLVNGTVLYYFKYALEHEELYPYFMAAGAITQFVAFLIFPSLVQKTSRKFVYIISAILMIVGYLGMFLFGSQKDSIAVVAAGFYCISSLGVALSLVSTTVMLADTVDYGEYKLGSRSESIVFSMQTMTVKFGNALAGFMTSMTLALVNYIPNQSQSESTLLGLRTVMFIASSILILIMILLYIKYYKLNGDFYKNMLSALEISRDQMKLMKNNYYIVHNSLDVKHVLLNVNAQSKDEIINKMIDTLKDCPHINNLEQLRADIFKREQLGATGIADGIAIPHAKSIGVNKTQIVIAQLEYGVDFNAPDHIPSDLIFLIASVDDGNSHIETMGRLSILINDKQVQDTIRMSKSPEKLLEFIKEKEKQITM